jgi:hypothetical protein
MELKCGNTFDVESVPIRVQLFELTFAFNTLEFGSIQLYSKMSLLSNPHSRGRSLFIEYTCESAGLQWRRSQSRGIIWSMCFLGFAYLCDLTAELKLMCNHLVPVYQIGIFRSWKPPHCRQCSFDNSLHFFEGRGHGRREGRVRSCWGPGRRRQTH